MSPVPEADAEIRRIRSTLQRSNFFKELCKKCDKRLLGNLFVHLTHSSPIPLGVHKIRLRPHDDSKTAKGRLQKKDIVALQSRAAKIAADIRAVNELEFVRELLNESVLNPEQLGRLRTGEGTDVEVQSLPGLLEQYANEFIPTVLDRRGNVGPQQHPDSDRLLLKICKHVRECHGRYHDALVAGVLDSLGFHPSQGEYTATALKQWRFNHGLTDSSESEHPTGA